MKAKALSPLTILFFTIFLDLLGFGLIIPILPVYASELGASGWVIGLLGGSYSLMQFFFAPFWGGLSDRIGRRPVMLSSIALVAVSYVLFAHSHNLFWLFLSRILAGIGSANLSAAQAFISDVSAPEKRAKNFGLVGAAFGLGFIFGPPVGGWLKSHYDIEGVGYVAAVLNGVNLLMALRWLPESLKERNPEAAFFSNPLANLGRMLKRAGINKLLVINFLFIGAFSMMQITAALLWKDHYHLNEAQIGYVFAFIGLVVAIIQGTLIGKFQNLFGERRLVLMGIVSMAIGLWGIPQVPVDWFVPMEFVCLLFTAFGNAFLTPTLVSLLSQQAGKQEQGQVLGVNQSVGSLARVVGPAAGGVLYGFHYSAPYWAGAILLAVMYFAFLIGRTRARHRHDR